MTIAHRGPPPPAADVKTVPPTVHPAEVELAEVSKRLVIVCIQAAQAYNSEQSKLQLDLVLSQDRLASAEGTKESRMALGHLSALTEAHKLAFEKIVLSASAALTKPLAELPDELREDYRERLVATVNWHLSAQSRFYSNRERWIGAARGLCDLVERCRPTAEFSPQGIVFAEDGDFDAFQALLGVVEETHRLEVAMLEERLSRIAKASSLLGLRPAQ